jgi:hypothetical protein
MTTMLYKSPGKTVRRNGDSFDWKIVEDEEVAVELKAGWHMTPADAIAKTKIKEQPAKAEVKGQKDS